jgi:hypothetical protein
MEQMIIMYAPGMLRELRVFKIITTFIHFYLSPASLFLNWPATSKKEWREYYLCNFVIEFIDNKKNRKNDGTDDDVYNMYA